MQKEIVDSLVDSLGRKVIHSPDQIREQTMATFPLQRNVVAVVKAENSSDISLLLKIANKFKVAVYPFSTGNNWGYGNVNSVSSNTILIDLSSMKKIVDFDEQLGVVTLQPGVTQGQLSQFLIESGYDYLVPVTGAGPNCSILANALERGYGLTPIGDHFQAVMSLKAILPDGSSYQSMHANLGAENSCISYKWGVGPYLDGLFTQGNFGVVTEMSIALKKRPESIVCFFIEVDEIKFEEAVALVQKLLTQSHGLIGGMNIMNSKRVMAMKGIPYKEVVRAKSDLQRKKILKKHKISDWTIIGSIYGTKGTVRAVKKDIKREFKHVATKKLFFDKKTLIWLKRLSSNMPFFPKILKEQINDLGSVFELLDGIPNEFALKQPYWCKGTGSLGSPIQPQKDQCGLIWFAPIIPMKINIMKKFIKKVEKICADFNIEPLITFSSVSERCFDSTMPILFDMSSEVQSEKARECMTILVDEVQKIGCYPYRIDVEMMRKLINEEGESTHWQQIARLKKAFDPNYILAPGRYSPFAVKNE